MAKRQGGGNAAGDIRVNYPATATEPIEFDYEDLAWLLTGPSPLDGKLVVSYHAPPPG